MKTSLTLAISLMATAASAQGLELSGPHAFEVGGTKRILESPRSMYFEAKLSPFTPLINDAFPEGGPQPYTDTFGGGPMLMGEVELDYQFFQKFGSLAAGISLGYAEKFGRTINAVTGAPVDASTGLVIIPIKALLVYRFDWLKEKFHVPLVPYAKLGAVFMPWWVIKEGEIEVFEGQRAEGVKFGLNGVLGIALELDFIDPRIARDFDSSMGVNHTYLFAEGTIQEMNLAPTATDQVAWNLSSKHFMFGLAFEF